MTIDHGQAISLEHIVRNVFNCDRFGLSGLADADHLSHHPFDAATIIISALYATGRVTNQREFEEFICRYSDVFDYPEENLNDTILEQYIDDLRSIANQYN